MCVQTPNILHIAPLPTQFTAWPHFIKKFFPGSHNLFCNQSTQSSAQPYFIKKISLEENKCINVPTLICVVTSQHNSPYGLISLRKFAWRKNEHINIPPTICVITNKHNSLHGLISLRKVPSRKDEHNKVPPIICVVTINTILYMTSLC